MKTKNATITLNQFVAERVAAGCLIQKTGKLYGTEYYCRESEEPINDWHECYRCQGMYPGEVVDSDE